MKTLKAKWVCALAVLAAACGGEKMSDARRAPSTEVEVDAPAAVSGQRMELRLLGGNGQDGSTVLLGVRELRVTYKGQELAADVAKAPVDLGNGQHAWLAGTFHVPEGADSVQVVLHLDDYGGFKDASGSGEIDARGAPIRFEAPVKSLSARGRAVVQLDLIRSLVDGGAERKVLLPHYGVSY